MNNYEKSDRIAGLLLSKAGDRWQELVLPIERGQGDSFVFKNLLIPLEMFLTRVSRVISYLQISLYYSILHISTYGFFGNFEVADNFFVNLIPGSYLVLVFFIYITCTTLDVDRPKGALGRQNQRHMYMVAGMIGLFQIVT